MACFRSQRWRQKKRWTFSWAAISTQRLFPPNPSRSHGHRPAGSSERIKRSVSVPPSHDPLSLSWWESEFLFDVCRRSVWGTSWQISIWWTVWFWSPERDASTWRRRTFWGIKPSWRASVREEISSNRTLRWAEYGCYIWHKIMLSTLLSSPQIQGETLFSIWNIMKYEESHRERSHFPPSLSDSRWDVSHWPLRLQTLYHGRSTSPQRQESMCVL